jgi:hypothetical protein
MDEDQLNHKVVENDSNFHSANDVYQVLQFALIEDSYDKFNNYVASDFDDIDYDFIPDPLPEITKGTFTVTRIKTTQSKKEKRAIQSTGKATRKLGQNGLLDKELKAIYTLFMVAKGRKCAFNYSGQSYRFDSDIFKCSYRSFGWDFAGIDLKQSIVHEAPKVNTLCHCIKIRLRRFFVNVTFYAGTAQGGEMWPNNSCGGGWVFKTLTPFSFMREDYPTNADVQSSIYSTATYEVDGSFATLMWNGQKKRLIPTGGASSGTPAPNQSVINKAINQGGVYHTTTCKDTPGWQSGVQPIYMLMNAGGAMNVANPVTIEFTQGA